MNTRKHLSLALLASSAFGASLGAQSKIHTFNHTFGPSLAYGIFTSDSSVYRKNTRLVSWVPSRYRCHARATAHAEVQVFGARATVVKFVADSDARQAAPPNVSLSRYSGASYSNRTSTYLYLQVANKVLRSQQHPTRSAYTSTNYYPAMASQYLLWVGPVPLTISTSVGCTLQTEVNAKAAANDDGNAYSADWVSASIGGKARAYNSASAWLSFGIPQVIGGGLTAKLKIMDVSVPINFGATTSTGLFGNLSIVFEPVSLKLSAWFQYCGTYYFKMLFDRSISRKLWTFDM